MPVGWGWPSIASMSWSRHSSDIAASLGVVSADVAGAVSWSTSSSSVFHAPQPVHWPAHCGWFVPHSRQQCTVLVLAMGGA